MFCQDLSQHMPLPLKDKCAAQQHSPRIFFCVTCSDSVLFFKWLDTGAGTEGCKVQSFTSGHGLVATPSPWKWVGWSDAEKSACKIGLQFRASLVNFFFPSGKSFSCMWVGGPTGAGQGSK